MDTPRFSERMGYVKIDRMLQFDSMSSTLRISLWNIFVQLNERVPRHSPTNYWEFAARQLYPLFYKKPLDDLTREGNYISILIKKNFFECHWYEVYDFLEFMVKHHENIVRKIKSGTSNPYRFPVTKDDLTESINLILEREFSGYRFIGGTLVPITEKIEISQINDALNLTQNSGLQGAHSHIQSAIQQFGKKPTPDYLNSIKESISAVESVVKLITGSKSSGLDGAMKTLSSKVEIHPALREGFVKLYSYSSDEGGIRHCILDKPSSVGFKEAKFMLVSCSAFVHFLIMKAEEAGVFKEDKKV